MLMRRTQVTSATNIVHKNDRDIVFEFLCRDHIISALKTQKSCSIDYRILAFKKTHYVRMTVRKTADCTHYIIGIENIDDEVRKEKELARRDDYSNRTELMERFRARILENLKSGSGPVMASGMAEYVPEKDNLVSEIFDRADKKMYENKRMLKKKEETQD